MWTDERVEQLKKLWSEGLSASQIAAQLGSVSRNAVIGKVHRLKLSGRGRTTSSAPRQKKVAPAGAPVKVTQKPQQMTTTRVVTTSIGATALQAQFEVAEPVARTYLRPVTSANAPVSRELKLIQLSERTCKWPNGDPLSQEFSFCGNEVGDHGPYCGFHATIAFQPASERRRHR